MGSAIASSKTLDLSKAAEVSLARILVNGYDILTLGQQGLQGRLQIGGAGLANRLELLVVCDLQAGAHIRGIVPEVHLQALVAKDSLGIAKDAVGHRWVEGVDCL